MLNLQKYLSPKNSSEEQLEGRDVHLLRLLGKLSVSLPKLPSDEWRAIFEFLDYYMVVQEQKTDSYVSFDWTKVREMLTLFDKIDGD